MSGPHWLGCLGNSFTEAPEWARLQRQLLTEMSDAALEFVDRYARPDGTLIWRNDWPGMDGSDDPYEGFRNLPLLYALGGADALLPAARRVWDGITWQWTEYGQLRQEFDRSYDWMHHGEAYLFTYFMGLADSASLKERQRARRFADFYVRNSTREPIFDPSTGHMRAPITGSDGPHFVHTREDWSTHLRILDEYLPPFEDLPGIDPTQKGCRWSDPHVLTAILERINTRQARGDVPINLIATSMCLHAFAFGGDATYRDFALNYLDSWRRRCEENGGILPDNVGLGGRIGEHNDGKWWGGFYGWRWPHGSFAILEALLIAGANAVVLTGDARHLDLARSQLDLLWSLGYEQGGQRLVPTRRYDGGWRDYRPCDPMYGVHLWNISQDPMDAERADRAWSSRFDRVDDSYGTYRLTNGGHVGFNGNTAQWFAYIRGNDRTYPEKILTANLSLMREQRARFRERDRDPRLMDHYSDPMAIHCWQFFMPMIVEGLSQLTLGGPMHVYHGGLQHVRLRYFDPERRRPGLPSEVAALVHGVSGDRVAFTLANLGDEARQLVVRGGAFGEHRFRTIHAGDVSHRVGRKDVALSIAPKSMISLSAEVDRYAAPADYRAPWEVDWEPLLRGRSA